MFFPQVHGVRLPPEWCASIKLACDEFNDETPLPPVVSSMRCLESMRETPIMCLLPVFILWSPLEQLATLCISFMCPKCAKEGINVSIHAIVWHDGTSGE